MAFGRRDRLLETGVEVSAVPQARELVVKCLVSRRLLIFPGIAKFKFCPRQGPAGPGKRLFSVFQVLDASGQSSIDSMQIFGAPSNLGLDALAVVQRDVGGPLRRPFRKGLLDGGVRRADVGGARLYAILHVLALRQRGHQRR